AAAAAGRSAPRPCWFPVLRAPSFGGDSLPPPSPLAGSAEGKGRHAPVLPHLPGVAAPAIVRPPHSPVPAHAPPRPEHSGAVPTDDLDVAGCPASHRAALSARASGSSSTGRPASKPHTIDGAVSQTFAPGPLVDADHTHTGSRGEFRTIKQTQHGARADGDMQVLGQPGAGLTTQEDTDS